jgi:hypothetical protein
MYNNLTPYDPKTANYIHAKPGLEKFSGPNTRMRIWLYLSLIAGGELYDDPVGILGPAVPYQRSYWGATVN